MSVLILKNIASEGPGTIEDYLKARSVSYRVVELGQGEAPPPLDGFETVVVLGGPMAVYEMDGYPHLVTASRLIREALNSGKKLLGICLGAQMMAHCLGAEVYKGPAQEVGWLSVELTGEGVRDPLMRALAVHPRVGDFWRAFKVFHWHGDTFELPMGARGLARSELYANQAFSYGDNAYAFQFHMEVTRAMVREWLEGHPEFRRIWEDTEKIYDEYAGRATNFYKAFFSAKDR
jgi:GMP synthase (glutamine-hydrolysing)